MLKSSIHQVSIFELISAFSLFAIVKFFYNFGSTANSVKTSQARLPQSYKFGGQVVR
ncbi:MAG: hypothetical protein KJ666_11180 [Bacteroidetes bacterium]|nr:hypothetical protein [Bacteroidota bacterium]MBU2585684.1 hypothetical protein [Bacteroidota bacterium]